MIPGKYVYLFIVLVGLIGWLYIFLTRKDLRKMMFWFSLVFGILGVIFSGYWFIIDWWHPVTITGTKVGIEDFLLGFDLTGIVMAIYAFFFKKTIVITSSISYNKLISIGLLVCSYFFIVYILIFLFHFQTFYSVYIASVFASIVMFIYRRDLLLPGITTGVLMVVCTIPIYWIIIFVSPQWIQLTYNFNHLSGMLITGIPIEEIVFFFLWSMFVGTFYEFWSGAKFERLK